MQVSGLRNRLSKLGLERRVVPDLWDLEDESLARQINIVIDKQMVETSREERQRAKRCAKDKEIFDKIKF